jgi:GTP cyclohydrolase II
MTNPRHEMTPLHTKYGEFEFHCFAWGPHEEDNVLCQVKRPFGSVPLVRIQSACYTAEIFRSTDCDCHGQLDTSLTEIASKGGILIYMLCDGRGAGLLKKVKGLALGHSRGLDTHDAYLEMNIPLDDRNYGRAAHILKYFKISVLRLLTNNPKKTYGLQINGLEVLREPLEIASTVHSAPYLKTKTEKMGHLISEFATD